MEAELAKMIADAEEAKQIAEDMESKLAKMISGDTADDTAAQETTMITQNPSTNAVKQSQEQNIQNVEAALIAKELQDMKKAEEIRIVVAEKVKAQFENVEKKRLENEVKYNQTINKTV